MKKVISVLAAGAAVLAMLPAMAMAVSLDGAAIFPGNQNQVWENPNGSVSIRTAIQAESGEVVHAIEYNFIDGGNLTTVCKDISNFEGAQKRTVTNSVNVPPNTGDYGLEINVFIAENVQEANARNGSAACQGDNDQVYSEGNVVHVVPNGSSDNNDNNGGTGTGGNDDTATTTPPAWFTAWLATQNTTNMNADKFLCEQFKANLVRSTAGVRTPWNAVLQGFLLGAGESIPSLVEPVKAPFGFSGVETAAAVGHFQVVHKCTNL